MICQKRIVLKLLVYNEDVFESVRKTEESGRDSELSSWNEAAIILLEHTSSLISNYINVMLVENGFHDLWSELCDNAKLFLRRSDLNLSASVYLALEKILREVDERGRSSFGACTDVVWDIWQHENPSTHLSPGRKATDNQEALVAYLHCLTALYPLLCDDLRLHHIESILKQLQKCATDSSPTAYSDDNDNLTILQSLILQCMKMLDDSIPDAVSELIRSSSFFVNLAFERNAGASGRGGPTFVALSKASMELLDAQIVKHCNAYDIYSDGSFLQALQALFKPISLKYRWRPEGKSPPTWQKATSTAVQILKVTINAQNQVLLETDDISATWQQILAILDRIIFADPVSAKKSASDSALDQAFDIEAFLSLFDLLIPALGSSKVPDRLRRSFTKSLFHTSIIHTPHPDDLPDPDSDEILANLNSRHIGRVCDLAPSRRSRIAYVCLDKLFELVAEHDPSSPERGRLAQAAAPFLILRAGIVLKAYVLDQPLRGRMPTPASQKKELLYVLRKLVQLESDPRAIPDAPGVRSQGKKHLYRVYGLVNKALGVARRDAEVHAALNEVLEVVAEDFGVE